MHLHRSNLTRDDDQDQETVEDDEHLPLIKRKRRLSQKNPKRVKLLREKSLKRPIFPSTALPIPKFESPPEQSPLLATVFDTETESESDTDVNQEGIVIDFLPEVSEINSQLADDLPQEYKSLMIFMGASSSSRPNLVLQKRLKKGDVDEQRNRFLIPQKKMRKNFLELEEEEKLNMKRWWMVEIIEPDCSVSLMTLSKWETLSGPAYVFITEWNGLVERNELKEGDLVQLWSFRVGGGVSGSNSGGDHGRLCFMLLEICDGEEKGHELGPSETVA